MGGMHNATSTLREKRRLFKLNLLGLRRSKFNRFVSYNPLLPFVQLRKNASSWRQPQAPAET